MEIRDIANAGGEILDAVTDAISSGNYNHLSENIRRSVGQMTSSVGKGLGDGKGAQLGGAYAFNEHLKGKSAAWSRPETLRTKSVTQGGVTAAKTTAVTSRQEQLPDTPYFRQGYRKLSTYTGTGQMWVGAGAAVVGGLGAGASGLAGAMLPGFLGGFAFFGAALFGVVLIGGIAAAFSGSKKRKLYVRYREYGRALGDAEYIAVDDMVRLTGIDRETVLKDMQTLQKSGVLPQVWIDKGGTTLMFTQNAFEQYQAAERARLQREDEQRTLSDRLRESVYGAQVTQILADGEAYLKTVRELNDRIPDAEMSRKISRIENLMHKTFEEVKEKPEAAPSLRKYMSYYLPTTVKLLNAYADLDSKPDIGTNIAQTKEEISNSLDMVGDGFEKLFDSLFEEMSMDIFSDISVMKTMMAQDGLAETTISVQ
ncbi:MAG: 5-bromo-4-chloroindolyl phosphate hydrolysis family protein [Lachnospiraceae bacterium]|nr:5-bromo-4-chloroindolyl phosphate hydrolysis family protein [Lachnospiraceae bacterium]